MFAVRIHGRGGQGAVTAAEMLSVAAFDEGRHAQAFPTFGSERTGAPVVSFCRIDDRPIRLREPISHPDALIVQDPTLLHQVDLFAGLKPDGLPAGQHLAHPRRAGPGRARRHPRRTPGRDRAGHRARPRAPRPPAAQRRPARGFAALTGQVGLDAVLKAIRDRFAGEVGEGNVRAAEAAYDHVTSDKAGVH